MDQQPTLIILVCYFGRLPSLFNVFLKSCGYNPSICWRIITDDRTPYDFPSNVQPVYIEFGDVQKRFQRHFDFRISLNYPYKLCDFRPAFGLAFDDLVEGFDFWGHSDIDMINGDIRKFLTREIFELHDKVLGFGHMAFYRNTDEVNSAFAANCRFGRKSSSYRLDQLGVLGQKWHSEWANSAAAYERSTQPVHQIIFSNDKYCHFDEWNVRAYGINDLLLDIGKRVYDGREFANLHIPVGHFELSRLTSVASQRPGTPCVFLFKQGQLLRIIAENEELTFDEFLYLHIQKRPMKNNLVGELPDSYLIIPNCFIPVPKELTFKRVKQLGKRCRFYPEYVKFKIRNIKAKLLEKFS
ncbi:DUF6625 family protein [Aporhodopirellula aestuarii]|nr:DUF6625 family protein [Aporhodopirellula aestuarii]